MSFTLLDNLFKLVNRGMDELEKADAKAFGKLLSESEGYRKICDRIAIGNKRKRDAWNEPVDDSVYRD